MNAIPLVFNAPKANINVNSVSPINANSIRTNNKLINATQGMNIGGAAGMLGGGGFSNEAQLRQEVNTSIVALKREAFSLENLIAQAAQTLQDINKRLSELEGKQGDYVKKADATVASVGGDGKYISAISETDGKINATATDLGNMVPVNSVTSGNMHSVTSNAVYNASPTLIGKMEEGLSDVTDGTEFISSYASDNGFSETEFENQPFKRKFIKVWNYIKAKISSWMDSTPTSGSSNPITSGAVKDYADTLIKIYHKNIGTYTVGGGQTISPDINSFTKPAPNGYARLSFLFAEDQNYFHCDVNSSNGVAYATITNKYTSSLSSRFTLYHIYIPWTGLIT